MRQRPERPNVIEVVVAAAIVLALVSSCTITRGPCHTEKEVKTATYCEKDGQVIHIEVLPP